MENENDFTLHCQKDVFFLENLFFIKNQAIKENDEMVRKTFQDLYKYVSNN